MDSFTKSYLLTQLNNDLNNATLNNDLEEQHKCIRAINKLRRWKTYDKETPIFLQKMSNKTHPIT